jgi:hypothetical protein
VDARFQPVGNLARREAEKLIVGYNFDLRTNALKPETVDNPAAGKQHKFIAYRLALAPGAKVAMRSRRDVIAGVAQALEPDE